MRFRCFLLFFFLCLGNLVYSQQNIADKTITVNFRDKPLKEVIKELRENSGILFTYSENMVPVKTKIDLSGQYKLQALMDEICRQSGIQYTIVGDQIVLHSKKNNSNKHTIKGFVTDAHTNETLIGATIYFTQLKTGQISNVYGFYSATMPSGSYSLNVSYVGYKPISIELNIDTNVTKDFKLEPVVFGLKEVVVKDSFNTLHSAYMGSEKLNLSEAGSIPVMFGEQDIIGLLMSKVGVQSINEGSSGLHVRGGGIHDNYFQLDEAPLFNINHLGGIASVFNPDALKTVNIYKGVFPVEYGGGLASIVDVRMKEGNQSNYVFKGGIGLISSRLMIEGPIKKEKSSFLISGRRSYLGDVIRAISDVNDIGYSKLYFNDLNVKANITLNNRNRLFLSGYYGNDIYAEQSTFSWGNTLGVIRWNHVLNEKIFMNTTLIRSYYSFNLTTRPGNNAYKWNSMIDTYVGKVDIDWYSGYNIRHSFGLIANYMQFAPVKITPFSERSIITVFELREEKTALYSLYYEAKKHFFDKLKINLGSRLNMYQKIGPGSKYIYNSNDFLSSNITDTIHYSRNQVMYQYFNLEPRMNITYMLDSSASIKAAFSRTTKFVHRYSLSSFFLTLDRMVSSTQYIKPAVSDIFSIGYFKNLFRNNFQYSAEIYYKNIDGITECMNYTKLLTENHTELIVLKGNGYVYGMEFNINGKAGRFRCNLNGSWSKVKQTVDGLNNNQPFSPYHDRGYDFNLNIQYRLTKRITLSTNTILVGGRYINLPVGQYVIDDKIVPQYYYNKIYLEKMPPYSRIDMGIYISGKQRPLRKWKGSLEICLYNIYSKNNYIGMMFRNVMNNEIDLNQQDAGINFKQALKPLGVSFSSFVPSITYNFSF